MKLIGSNSLRAVQLGVLVASKATMANIKVLM
jgi:hypothetical protein